MWQTGMKGKSRALTADGGLVSNGSKNVIKAVVGDMLKDGVQTSYSTLV